MKSETGSPSAPWNLGDITEKAFCRILETGHETGGKCAAGKIIHFCFKEIIVSFIIVPLLLHCWVVDRVQLWSLEEGWVGSLSRRWVRSRHGHSSEANFLNYCGVYFCVCFNIHTIYEMFIFKEVSSMSLNLVFSVRRHGDCSRVSCSSANVLLCRRPDNILLCLMFNDPIQLF